MHEVHRDEGTDEDIICKHTMIGTYSSSLAYKAHFLGSTLSPMHHAVWKDLAPSKVKFFGWLTIQNRIWMTDRLEKWGCPNCVLCLLCKRETKTMGHLFYKCRFVARLW